MTVYIQQGENFGYLEEYIDEVAPAEENYKITKTEPSHIAQGAGVALGTYPRTALVGVASGFLTALVNPAPGVNSVVKGTVSGSSKPFYYDILLNPVSTPLIKMRFLVGKTGGDFAIYTSFAVALVHITPVSDLVGPVIFNGWVGVSSGSKISAAEAS